MGGLVLVQNDDEFQSGAAEVPDQLHSRVIGDLQFMTTTDAHIFASLNWWFYLKEPHPSSFLTMSILTMTEEVTDLKRLATLAIQIYSLEIPIKNPIRKLPESMLFAVSDSSDHLTNVCFYGIAKICSPRNIRVQQK